jgi:hypothetical protein
MHNQQLLPQKLLITKSATNFLDIDIDNRTNINCFFFFFGSLLNLPSDYVIGKAHGQGHYQK